jgi:hypothetical protein
MSYVRFGCMIATSTIVMFGLMYLNTYAVDHMWFSQTRAWMALIMGATMAVIMLTMMWHMYSNKFANIIVMAASVTIFAASLWLVRSQETVGDIAYMEEMIPHHSIAIMTTERAHIRDPRVRHLADGIIEAQVREIGEMEKLIGDLRQKVDLLPYRISLPCGRSVDVAGDAITAGAALNHATLVTVRHWSKHWSVVA